VARWLIPLTLLAAACPAPRGRPAPTRPPDAAASAAPPGNRLAGQRSLYLRQHAKNPVDWYPWGPEALARSRTLDRPIFLSIGYASCHWCHVMEREVFEHEEVARALNQDFVSVKVDREERPDIDAVYMTAVQAMTGSGGWPLSVFLTPELKPFFGGTYFPRKRFMTLLERVGRAYKERPEDLARMSRRLHAAIARDGVAAGDGQLPAVKVARAAFKRALENMDPVWGGDKGRMKFPMPSRWLAMLHRHRRTGDPALAAAVGRTLDQMASGGMRDHLAGGFHRYTTEPTWLVPHFEKMLYDNAQLASLYLSAYRVLGRAAYGAVARQTLDFMIKEMQGEQGGFYASFDADSGGEEGSFYVWSPAELQAVAGPKDGPVLAELLGVTARGNFEGKSILTRRSSPRPGALEVLARWREPLLAARALRPRPGLDRKVITAWNGMAIVAMARGYQVLREDRYLTAARAAAFFLWDKHRGPKSRDLLRSSNGGVAENMAILDDYAHLAAGLLALHQADGMLTHLRRAVGLVDLVRRDFAHRRACFYLTPRGHEAPMGRQVLLSDGARPSGNGVLLQTMLALSALTGRRGYRDEVKRCLSSQGEALSRAGLGMAVWLDLLDRMRGPYYEVVIAGDPAAKDTRALLAAYRLLDPHHAVLAQVPAAGPDDLTARIMPVTKAKLALGGKATAYVCQHHVCKAPTSSPVTLRAQLLEGWKR